MTKSDTASKAQPPKAARTARDRARAELTREITDTARRQLAVAGADGLSLRAVARELGMVSSAVYRYFPSRDDLLTALIIDAYDALGAAVERADAALAPDSARTRWLGGWRAVRTWARAHPHEYALIYGSPIPGYAAPAVTVTSAARVPLVLLRVLRDGAKAGGLVAPVGQPPLTPRLTTQLAALAASVEVDLSPATLTRAVLAWTQLFGMVSFELFGQLVGSLDPSDEFFEHSAAEMATFVGLPE